MEKIFVFGSNLAGIHGAGSAKEALNYHGASYGKGIGRQGNSYAIPTMDKNFEVLSLQEIKRHIDNFLIYAEDNPDLEFNVVEIGCGIAGYTPQDIAPMFLTAPENVKLSAKFKDILFKLRN